MLTFADVVHALECVHEGELDTTHTDAAQRLRTRTQSQSGTPSMTPKGSPSSAPSPLSTGEDRGRDPWGDSPMEHGDGLAIFGMASPSTLLTAAKQMQGVRTAMDAMRSKAAARVDAANEAEKEKKKTKRAQMFAAGSGIGAGPLPTPPTSPAWSPAGTPGRSSESSIGEVIAVGESDDVMSDGGFAMATAPPSVQIGVSSTPASSLSKEVPAAVATSSSGGGSGAGVAAAAPAAQAAPVADLEAATPSAPYSEPNPTSRLSSVD